MESKPNIIFILIDACGYGHTSLSGYVRDTTPFLREFAKESVEFKNTFSHSPISGLSIGSFMTSSYAFDHQQIPIGVDSSRPSIAKLLQQQGYFTSLISANPYYAKKFGYAEGVNEYRMLFNEEEEIKRMGQDGVVVRAFKVLNKFSLYRISKEWLKRNARRLYSAGLMAKTIATTRNSPFGDAGSCNEEILKVLRTRDKDKPLYLQVQYMDLHAPNLPPAPFLEGFNHPITAQQQYLYGKKRSMRPIPEFSSKEQDDLVMLYDACLAHIDSRIQEVCVELKEQGIYDSSLIIVAADHGEAFFEHGDLGHHALLYEENIRVPLLIKFPYGAGAGSANEHMTSLIDVAPTIATSVGIKHPGTFVGEVLAPESVQQRDHTVSFVAQRFTPSDVAYLNFTNYTIALRTKEWKLIVTTGKKDELYDLVSDPGEKTNLVDDATLASREAYEHMRQKLEPYLARLQSRNE